MAGAASTMARALFLCLVMASLALSSSAQSSCATFTFSQNRLYSLCNSLQRLGSTLHWTYHPSNATVDIAYRAPQNSNGWVAWGINPSGARMVGTQALVAFQNTTTGSVRAYTTPISSFGPSMQPADISYSATGVQGEFSDGVFIIYATLQLTDNQTQVSHVWQSSTIFNAAGYPGGHNTNGDNVNSAGTLNFLSGESATAGNSRLHRRNSRLHRESGSIGSAGTTGRKLLK